jgi:sulfate adenylyltransferase subunit 1
MLTAVANERRVSLNEFLGQEIDKELLRFTTAGSVDDGKSTLIGRLLHDCKAVYEDQLASVRKSPVNRSGKEIDFSLLTDGLRAEREQGITIDVAYRYFSTPRRKFIIADTPGHEQYTRNMATGASSADLAIILVDATKDVLPQTRRHTYIAFLLGIPHVIAAINKMDLVAYREEAFSRLQHDFAALAEDLGMSSVQSVPISALEGDNIVERSTKTPWYTGPTLLEHLEAVPLRRASEQEAMRFPVQMVVRPDATFRGFAGRIASGTIRPGDEVFALPSLQRSRVESLVTFGENLESAGPGQSVVLKLADEIDLSRGDMLVSPEALPQVSNRFSGMVVWLHQTPLQLDRTFLAKHSGRYVKARAVKIRFRVNVNTLTEHPATELAMNEIACVEFETSQPLLFDAYEVNRTTGSLILIDPLTNATVGAVMLRENLSGSHEKRLYQAVRFPSDHPSTGIQEARIHRRGHRPAVLTLTGGRGQAEALERELLHRGFDAVLVDFNEVPAAAREVFYETLWNLGHVILSWHDRPLRVRDRGLFDALARDSHFELPRFDRPEDEKSRWEGVITIVETLRVNSDSPDRRRD